MSDLISRSALRQEILDKMPQGSKRGVFLAFVDDQPTAYDTDKVVEQLENARIKYQRLCVECEGKEDKAMDIHYNNIIEIVKGGGTSES